jgi:Bacterial cell division membrane protein
MGICRWSTSHRWIRVAPDDVSLCGVFAGDQLGLLLVVGITALIFTHIFQNMGMTIAMLPITGVPLPLISYSGSFVLMIMFGLGLVNSVWIHRKIPA